MQRAILTGLAFALPLPALAQSPNVYTGRTGAPAVQGDPIKLQEAINAGLLKQDYLTRAGAGTIAFPVPAILGRVFDIADYGAVASSNPANGGMNSLAVQRAFNACYAAGGGVVRVRSGGAAYHIATGLTETGNVCGLVGDRVPNWPGPVGTEAQWTAYGSWLACDDLTKPCLKFSGSGYADGLNFWRTQPTPSGTAGVSWTPSDVATAGTLPPNYPWSIQFTQNFSWAKNIQLANVSYGINFEYPVNANIAGTYSGLEHIWGGCFVTCLRIKSANDTMRISDYHGRLLWNIGNSNVIDWKETHSTGWDLEYVDNLQADAIEFYKEATSIFFADATAVYGTGTATHAAENLQLSHVSFNQVVQAVNLAAGTTTVSANFSDVIGQSDTDTNRAAGFFFNLASDNADVTFNGLDLSAVGNSVMSVGSGNRGRVTINGGVKVRSPLQASGTSYSGYGYLGNGSPAFVLARGSTLSVPGGVQDVVAGPSAGPVTACAAPTGAAGSNCGAVLAMVQPSTPTTP